MQSSTNERDQQPTQSDEVTEIQDAEAEATQSDEVTKIWDTEAETDTSKMNTDKEILYSDDDSLPDLFPLSQPKKFDTKNPAYIPKKPHNK